MNQFATRYVFWLPVLAMLFIASTPVLVLAEIPDLRGTWMACNDDSIRKNAESDSDDAMVRVVFQIEKQRGRHFEGRTISGRQSEKLIGLISSDNRSFYAIDDHRTITGRIVSASEIEISHQETGRTFPFVTAIRLERR